MASIAGGAYAFQRLSKSNARLGLALLFIASIYLGITLSPLWPKKWSTVAEIISAHRTIYRQVLPQIQTPNSITAEAWLLPRASSRAGLYDVNRVYRGIKEYTNDPYPAPCDAQAAVISQSGIALALMRDSHYRLAGLERLRELMACSPAIKATADPNLSVAYDLDLPTPTKNSFKRISNLQFARDDNAIIISGSLDIANLVSIDKLLWRAEVFDEEKKSGAVVFQSALSIFEPVGNTGAARKFSLTITSKKFIDLAASTDKISLLLVENQAYMETAWLNSLTPLILPPKHVYDYRTLTTAIKKNTL